MTKLNFRINPSGATNLYYDQVVTFQVTPIQDEEHGSPSRRRPLSPPATAAAAHRSRIRTLSSGGASSSCCSTTSIEVMSEVEMRNTGKYIANWSRKQQRKRERKQKQSSSSPTGAETELWDDYDDHDNDYDDYDESSYSSQQSSSSSLSSVFQQAEYSSNERLLLIAFVTFMSFSVTQLYFAFMAESEAMKGDSAAMMVDSATYFFNWIAERRKHNFDDHYRDPSNVSPSRARALRQRTKRKVILQLEIIPPLISVSTLLIVTGIVLRKALQIIYLDIQRDPNDQSDPNVNLMLMFALGNLGLDTMNFCCFARARHLFGFDTNPEEQDGRYRRRHNSALSRSRGNIAEDNDGDHVFDFDQYDQDEEEFMQRHHHAHANLNMCSAYTHVFADTLRSIAVIIAAALAELFDEVSAEEADAAAALVVSLLILLSLVPLFQGLVQSAKALWAIRAEERSEAMMDEIKAEERKRRENFWNAGRVDEWST